MATRQVTIVLPISAICRALGRRHEPGQSSTARATGTIPATGHNRTSQRPSGRARRRREGAVRSALRRSPGRTARPSRAPRADCQRSFATSQGQQERRQSGQSAKGARTRRWRSWPWRKNRTCRSAAKGTGSGPSVVISTCLWRSRGRSVLSARCRRAPHGAFGHAQRLPRLGEGAAPFTARSSGRSRAGRRSSRPIIRSHVGRLRWDRGRLPRRGPSRNSSIGRWILWPRAREGIGDLCSRVMA